MRTFHCDKCGQLVFFENIRCERCGSMLGYEPECRSMNAFEPAGNGAWKSLNPVNNGQLFKQCLNYWREEVCNWMLPVDARSELCPSCLLTRVIPSLTSERNKLFWKRLETAKRRLLYSLWELDLQPKPKFDDPESGLAFEFLEDTPDRQVMTGHSDGLITLNIVEADPAHRERTREQMGEPYRTLLGHFRHESGHYYFDRLIVDTRWIEPFRTLFGDERQDYGESLQRHYDNGPPDNWDDRFVSAYASSHPWEDWAETWAHYLHMIDTLDTAYACGVGLRPRKPGEPELVIEERPLRNNSFDEILEDWFALSYVLNSLNRSVGMPDPYPFTLSSPVIEKLRFVHDVVMERKAVALPPVCGPSDGQAGSRAAS